MGAPALEDAPSGRSWALLSDVARFCSLTALFGLEYRYPYSSSAEDLRSANSRIQPGRGTRSRLPRKVEGFMRKALLVVILAGASAFAGTVSGSLSFSNTPLLRPEGESEPAVAVANDGTVAVTGLQWVFTLASSALTFGPVRSAQRRLSRDCSTQVCGNPAR